MRYVVLVCVRVCVCVCVLEYDLFAFGLQSFISKTFENSCKMSAPKPSIHHPLTAFFKCTLIVSMVVLCMFSSLLALVVFKLVSWLYRFFVNGVLRLLI